MLTRLAERPPAALGERLAAEPRERLRRAEATRRAADEQDARQPCTRHGSLDIPSLRDALGTTRKFLIPLLEHFDALGLTTRLGANRVLKKR